AGMVDGFFQYGGDKFQGTDYTIFVVAKLEDLLIPYPAYFLYGTSPTPLKNLSVGFWDDHTLILSHRGHDCRGLLPAQYSADQYNVYTFRFSQEDGMSIYVDLEREPINCDASKTSALLEHPGGRVGSSGGDPILIAEILAYGVAASEAQRLSIIRGIKERYSLPAP
ncbi:MAG: hypothetical protein JXB45_05895, partial [Candidatus Krumholzibacteriota bacterium]|nr:hypothetical protein [Candidatus Krumholzibacteriota bacterium]